MSLFAQRVYKLLARVPHGRVTTYGAIASLMGKPRAARAVGQALHRNPTPVTVPCHRVVHADGRVGGYIGGIRKKVMLLRREGLPISVDHVQNLEKYIFQASSIRNS